MNNPWASLVVPAMAAAMAGHLRGGGGNIRYPVERGPIRQYARRYVAPHIRRRIAPTKKKYRKPKIPKSKVAKNSQNIKSIKQRLSLDTGTHIQKTLDTGRLIASARTMAHSLIDQNNASEIETVLANLKYYDPSNPAVLVTASAASGTFTKQFLFKNIYSHIVVRNNYQVPAEVTLYIVAPKNDTSKTAIEAYTEGLNDIGGPSSTSPMMYLSDSPVFKKLYKVVKQKSKVLEVGKTMSLNHSIKNLVYDPAYNDAHTSTYKPVEGAFSYVIRVTGVVGHDTTITTEQLKLPCGVDYEINRKWEISYQAGCDLHTVDITDNSSASFTNGGVVSNKPDANNQSYSQS